MVWALAIACVGFNVMHDSNHGGYSNHPRVNKLVSLSAEMLGMSGFRWRIKHNVWHHTYTNIAGFDFIMHDFMMVFVGKSDAVHAYPKMNAADKAIFWAGKVFFFAIMFALPLLVFPWWQVLIGFFIVMLTVGLVMGVVFQLAHISGEADFPEPIGNPLHIENEWAVHQVETTADFAPRNRLLNWYIGGLNYQADRVLMGNEVTLK